MQALHSQRQLQRHVVGGKRPAAGPGRHVRRTATAAATEPGSAAAPLAPALPRRAALAAAAAAALALSGGAPAPPAAAAVAVGAAALVQYTDMEGFTISVPEGWARGEGELPGNSSFTGASGSRRTLAWFPADGSADPADVNVSVTITNTSREFTKLGSFGTPYAFGQNLVNSMDTSFLARARGGKDNPSVQVAKLVDATEKNSMYYVEYTVFKPALEAQPRHLLSSVSLGDNGRYNRLITVTAQCRENQLDQFRPLFDQMLASYRPPAKRA